MHATLPSPSFASFDTTVNKASAELLMLRMWLVDATAATNAYANSEMASPHNVRHALAISGHSESCQEAKGSKSITPAPYMSTQSGSKLRVRLRC